MSILIKDMKMPKMCCDCDLLTDIDWGEQWECPITEKIVHKYVKERKGKPSDCPLIEIPPHGRLIDADNLMKPFRDLLEKDEHSLDYYSVGYEGLNAMINDLPTVIESEEQEHE